MSTRQAPSSDPCGLATWIFVIRVFHSLIWCSRPEARSFSFYSWPARPVNVRGGMTDGPWELPGDGERGVLCLHGFTGTPFEVRPLGDALAARGIGAVGPRLTGHEDVESLARTGWIDWLNEAEAELARLRRRYRRVAVAGLSLGGLLALSLARRHRDLRALCALSTPLWLPPAVAVAIRALAYVTRARLTSIPKAGADIRDAAAKRSFPTLGAMPLATLRSMLDLMTRVRAELPHVRVPTLVMHGD